VFRPLGIDIKWVDFQFGPPLLEAINVGSVDFGYVGDSPPILAHAANARIRYVAAVKQQGSTQAIIVPQDSPIKTRADLKGKRVAFGKGSSAHNLLVAALEKAGLSWSDITPAPLAPADATAAFAKGSVDAWSIWDAYFALAELKEHARVIAFNKDVHRPNAFYIASTEFVDKYPALIARLNAVFAAEGMWADQHHEEVAKAQAEATGVDIEAIRRFVDRSIYRVVPVDGEVIQSQQAVADRFAHLGLIPKSIDVCDVVWKCTPDSSARVIKELHEEIDGTSRLVMSAHSTSQANILWFLPTHGDGRYLGTTTGGREVNFNYLRQIAQAEQLGYFGVLLPTRRSGEDSWVVASAVAPWTERLRYLIAVRPALQSPSVAAPLGALDALTRISMQRLLERVWQEQAFTAILVTHDVAEAVALADRILVIEDGPRRPGCQCAHAAPTSPRHPGPCSVGGLDPVPSAAVRGRSRKPVR
jgi:sulfonate transport system substrate-binding protein